jgi:hypothetical protein
MFPFSVAWKIFPELLERLYGVVPPEIVIAKLCPVNIETLFWLKEMGPPVLA